MNARQIAIIIASILTTQLSRFLPFLLIRSDRPTPKFIDYLGKVLPPAVFALLVVYALKDVHLLTYPYGIPEAMAIIFLVVLHVTKRHTLLSIGGSTLLYMVLVQTVFSS